MYDEEDISPEGDPPSCNTKSSIVRWEISKSFNARENPDLFPQRVTSMIL